MYEIGYDEYITNGGVCIIEWAELIEELLPEDCIRIEILKDDEKGDDFRIIRIK